MNRRRIRRFLAPLAVPSTFVIDRAGRLRYVQGGAFDLHELNTLVPLLNESASTH